MLGIIAYVFYSAKKNWETVKYLKNCTSTESLSDDLVVTFSEIVILPDTSLINANGKTNYWVP